VSRPAPVSYDFLIGDQEIQLDYDESDSIRSGLLSMGDVGLRMVEALANMDESRPVPATEEEFEALRTVCDRRMQNRAIARLRYALR
jgi:hypothetical protein